MAQPAAIPCTDAPAACASASMGAIGESFIHIFAP
jgi:hypothetical protein